MKKFTSVFLWKIGLTVYVLSKKYRISHTKILDNDHDINDHKDIEKERNILEVNSGITLEI